MSLHRQSMEKEYAWLLSELKAATTADVVQSELEPLPAEDLDRVKADNAFLLVIRLLKALLVDKVAKQFQTYAEEQRMRRDLQVAGIRHKALIRGLMTLKLRRFNHIGRILEIENELSPKTPEKNK